MATKNPAPRSRSRRTFLKVTAAVAGAASFPFHGALAQKPARFRRVNITDPGLGSRALASYRKAIRAMLALPPGDPRNWYRIALTHTLDCPHGNWWFLVWHRGFIGWFERICRELSGDAEFALPYWDWSENRDPAQPFRPGVPAVMFDDVLTPEHSAFIGKSADFRARFADTVAKAGYWKRVLDADGNLAGDSQYAQLLARGIRFPQDLWFDILDDPRGLFFFDRAHARGVTRASPELDAKTAKAVSLQTLLDALGPRDFLTFGSPRTAFHSGLTGFGVLEGQPHNRVHNNVGGISTTIGPDGKAVTKNTGGFMQANLSPVDPLFFLHHANIDRLWDLWTRKQLARGYPILPTGYPARPGDPVPGDSDYAAWSAEPFVFFVDDKGLPVPPGKRMAGAYASIGDFDYDYQPGSGEEIVQQAVKAGAQLAPLQVQRFAAHIDDPRLGSNRSAGGTVTGLGALLQADPASDSAAKLYAHITLSLPALAHGADFAVLVNAPADAATVAPSSPHHAATLSMFGHHTMQGPVTFTVPLSGALASMRAGKLLATQRPMAIRVVPDAATTPPHGMHATDATVHLHSIVVEAH